MVGRTMERNKNGERTGKEDEKAEAGESGTTGKGTYLLCCELKVDKDPGECDACLPVSVADYATWLHLTHRPSPPPHSSTSLT